jgi:ArsR family transcriptional regulator
MNIQSYERREIKVTGKTKNKNVLGEVDLEKLGEFFKVLSEKARLRILNTLLGGGMCVMHLSEAVEMSQSATSHQLAILRRANLVKVTRSGKNLIYSISDEHVRLVLDMALLHINEE